MTKAKRYVKSYVRDGKVVAGYNRFQNISQQEADTKVAIHAEKKAKTDPLDPFKGPSPDRPAGHDAAAIPLD